MTDGSNDAVDFGNRCLKFRLARFEKFLNPGQALGNVLGRDAAGMERTHRKLRARLADRLSGDNTDDLADLDDLARRKVAAITADADAAFRIASDQRANLHFLHTSLHDSLRQIVVDICLRGDHDFARFRIYNRLVGETPANPVVKGDVAFLKRGHDHSLIRAAILLGNGDVLAHVNEAAGKIARLGRFQSRVGRAFPGAVRRDKELGHRQSLAEGSPDRDIHDLAVGLGHYAAHPRKLNEVGNITAGAAVAHHIQMISRKILLNLGVNRVFKLLLRFLPDLDNALAAFFFRHITLAIKAVVFIDLLLGFRQDFFLDVNDPDVLRGDRDAGNRGVLKPKVFHPVESFRRLRKFKLLKHLGDNLA